MAFTHRIGTFRVLLLAEFGVTNGRHAGFVYLYDPSGRYVGYVGGVADGTELPENVVHENGVVNLYVSESDLRALIAHLRAERLASVRAEPGMPTDFATPEGLVEFTPAVDAH